MALDAFLPIGFQLPDGARVRRPLLSGNHWQIVETDSYERALLALDQLAGRWFEAGLIGRQQMMSFRFGDSAIWAFRSEPDQLIVPVADSNSPDTKSEAMSFALALKATREIDPLTPLQDALFVEKISRLLPAYSISSKTDDEIVLGYWLTGGARVSVRSFRKISLMMSWLGADHLQDVIEAAGFTVADTVRSATRSTQRGVAQDQPLLRAAESGTLEGNGTRQVRSFELAGRPELAAFFNEHIVDIVMNRERYKALGIDFPSAVILHGPPGTGKTFAVEQLIEFLGWPSFQIDASTVASPYIHETSKKVAQVFEAAIENAPSVLVIDEMEAFLADREMGSGHHRVEEVAEFLRRIPEAAKKEVLIIAMTNRIEMIDPAVQRRGRFDHVVHVNFASEVEVEALLQKLLSVLPQEGEVDTAHFASELAGRPLSDVAFVVREGARLAARSGRDRLRFEDLQVALTSAPAREREGSERRRIGFV